MKKAIKTSSLIAIILIPLSSLEKKENRINQISMKIATGCEQMPSLHWDHLSQFATEDRLEGDTRHENVRKMINQVIRRTLSEELRVKIAAFDAVFSK